jgi:fructan beta-fructosidase
MTRHRSLMHRTVVLAIALLAAWSCRARVGTPVATTRSVPTEPHRPAFHFTPPAKWMNDPNGMVFYDGEYHLCYQHYPDSSVWGPMHWGHAVSADLVRWQHLPIALAPDSLGLIFSGSAVVDSLNTSGFGVDGKPPLVALFTYHNMAREKAGDSVFQTQGLAYSTDRGRTWTKYAGNPVLPNLGLRDMRDPKVIWHSATRRWIMILAAGDHVRLFASRNLRQWNEVSQFGREWGAHGGVWECPDLFEIRVDGTTQKRWVMLVSMNPGGPNGGSATQYFVGKFDGARFEPDSGFARTTGVSSRLPASGLWLDHGRDNYAGVTWSGVPTEDGRRLFIGWMSNWDYARDVPTQAWRSAMTIPRSLSLHATPSGMRLYSAPVQELRTLRDAGSTLSAARLAGSTPLKLRHGATPASLEIDLEFVARSGTRSTFAIELSTTGGETYRVGYDLETRQYFSDRTGVARAFSDRFASGVHRAARLSTDSIVRMHLFIDRASVELFADGGATVMTDIVFPTTDFSTAQLVVRGDAIPLRQATIYGLRSIW